jgi:hyperosmotically inducible periplasmic protein
MRSRMLVALTAAILMIAVAVGCSKQSANPRAMKDQVQQTLKQNGMDKINVDEDKDKGVITLKGDVKSEDEKMKASTLAQRAAPGRVIANELALRPEGMEREAKKIESNTDDAIENYWKAAVAANKWENQHIRADAKNGVLTLKGDVDTPAQRAQAEKVAAGLPGVQQVVNELEVKGRKGQ